jgi:hypothetical protein
MLPPEGVYVQECTHISYETILCWQPCLEIEVSKVEWCLCMKIPVLHERNAGECHVELHEAWVIVPYHREQLQGGRRHSEMKRIKFQHASQWTFYICLHTDMTVALTEQCMDEDRHWTVKDLAEHTGISGTTVLQILQQDLKVHKIAAKLVPHHLSEVQQWT